MLSLQKDEIPWLQPWITPGYVGLYMVIIALMMASRIPTFSFKKIPVRRELSSAILTLAGIFLIGIILKPWFTLPLMGVIYLGLIPFSSFHYYQLQRKEKC